jgi:hypothetical protein
MQNNQSNSLRRGHDTLAYMEEHESIVSSNFLILSTMDDLGAYCSQLDSIGGLQADGTEPHTLSKHEQRETLTFSLLAVCASLHALGTKTHRKDIRAMGSKSFNFFKRKRELDLVATGESIIKFASPLEDVLMGHGLDAGQLADADEKVKAFSNAISEPTKYKGNRKGATQNVPRLLKEITELLVNRLDGLVRSYYRTHPEFVAGYFAVRRIQNLGVRHTGKAEGVAPEGDPTV